MDFVKIYHFPQNLCRLNLLTIFRFRSQKRVLQNVLDSSNVDMDSANLQFLKRFGAIQCLSQMPVYSTEARNIKFVTLKYFL